MYINNIIIQLITDYSHVYESIDETVIYQDQLVDTTQSHTDSELYNEDSSHSTLEIITDANPAYASNTDQSTTEDVRMEPNVSYQPADTYLTVI